MKQAWKKILSFFLFILTATFWSGVFFILPEFVDNPSNGFNGFIIIAFHWSLVLFATFFLLYAAAANKYVFAVFFPLFSLLGAVLAFYRYAYKATLTPMLIDASLHNDLGTTLDLISPELIVYVLLSVIVSVFFVRFRFKKVVPDKWWLHFFVAIISLGVFFNLNNRVKTSIFQRFPFSVYFNVSEYNKLHLKTPRERISPDSVLNEQFTDSLTVVFVLGESLRADHLRLNGYHRQTNPFLSKTKNIHSLGNVYSEYTNTNRSLPHILTRADSANTEVAFTEQSFISLFRQCGYSTSWISNQDPAETYVDFINECDTAIYAHPEKSVYNYNNWLDEDLLVHAKQILSKGNSRNLIVLHTIGSHWYYNNHFSKKCELFRPVTPSRIIAQCTSEEIVNSYDNTVVYTDYFLHQLISVLKNKNALMIYLSDHGEVLGEDGMWLHAGDHIASKNPACIVWYSDTFAKKYPDKVTSVAANKANRLRTDFLFHSILDGGEIPTKLIREDLNIFGAQ